MRIDALPSRPGKLYVERRKPLRSRHAAKQRPRRRARTGDAIGDRPRCAALKIFADEARSLSTIFAEAVDAFVGRLQAAETGALAPVVGEPLLDFVLPDLNGGLVSRGEILPAGPAVIAFLRGHWRPYRHTTAAALGEIADAAAAQGSRSIAIATSNRKFTQRLARDSGERAPILADRDNGYSKARNFAIWFDRNGGVRHSTPG
jgi:peroxiredoxin